MNRGYRDHLLLRPKIQVRVAPSPKLLLTALFAMFLTAMLLAENARSDDSNIFLTACTEIQKMYYKAGHAELTDAPAGGAYCGVTDTKTAYKTKPKVTCFRLLKGTCHFTSNTSTATGGCIGGGVGTDGRAINVEYTREEATGNCSKANDYAVDGSPLTPNNGIYKADQKKDDATAKEDARKAKVTEKVAEKQNKKTEAELSAELAKTKEDDALETAIRSKDGKFKENSAAADRATEDRKEAEKKADNASKELTAANKELEAPSPSSQPGTDPAAPPAVGTAGGDGMGFGSQPAAGSSPSTSGDNQLQAVNSETGGMAVPKDPSGGEKKGPNTGIKLDSGECSGAVQTMLAKKVKEKCPADECKTAEGTRRWLNSSSEGASIKSQAESFSCNSAQTILTTMQVSSQILGATAQATAGAVGGAAVSRVESAMSQSGASGANLVEIHREALHEMADASRTTAYTQFAFGGTQLITGGWAIGKGASYSGDANKVQAAMNESYDDGELTNSGMGHALTTNKEILDEETEMKNGKARGKVARALSREEDKLDRNPNDKDAIEKSERLSEKEGEFAAMAKKKITVEKANDAGARSAQAAVQRERQFGDSFLAQGAQSLLQGAAAAANGLSSILYADQLDKMADALRSYDQEPLAPMVPGTPNGQVSDAAPPPVVAPQNIGGDGNPALAASDNGPGAGAPAIPPPVLGGGGNPGGLKDTPPAPTNGMVGPGSTSGGGSNGSGLGSLGGGSDGSGKEDKPHGDSLTTGNGKFESTGGGAAGFGGVGSAPRRDSNTGMGSLSEALAALAANGKELADRKPGSILDGKKGGDKNDPSILGPDSNLFVRVSQTTTAAFQKGRLK